LIAGRAATCCQENKDSNTDTQRFHEVPVASSVNATECGRLGPQIVYERLLGLSVLLSLRISVSTAGSVTTANRLIAIKVMRVPGNPLRKQKQGE